MKRLGDLFKPRQNNFTSLLIQQAEWAVKGLQALLAFVTDGNEASAEVVGQAEKEADEVRRILIEELNRTFSTPMDREDIFALSRAIDDIIDYAYSTVDEMQVLHVTANTYIQRMVSLLRDAANEVHMAMLRIKDHPGVATEHAQRAKALENRVESVYREAIAALFEGPAEPKHIVEMLKLREIYRHLSNAADRGDEAANIISDVVVKMT
jgi:predicted phosphate transport protein (TIGR00153 family)